MQGREENVTSSEKNPIRGFEDFEPTSGDELVAFREFLFELELSWDELRRDPTGKRWLPKSFQLLVEQNAVARRELEEFVNFEREMHCIGDRPTDVLFLKRVMDEVPKCTFVQSRRRQVVLTMGYLAAAVSAGIGLAAMLRTNMFLRGWEAFHQFFAANRSLGFSNDSGTHNENDAHSAAWSELGLSGFEESEWAWFAGVSMILVSAWMAWSADRGPGIGVSAANDQRSF